MSFFSKRPADLGLGLCSCLGNKYNICGVQSISSMLTANVLSQIQAIIHTVVIRKPVITAE